MFPLCCLLSLMCPLLRHFVGFHILICPQLLFGSPLAALYGLVYLLLCTDLISPIYPVFDLASRNCCAPALSGPPHLAHGRRPFFCFGFTNRALPHQARTPVPKAAMIYKLASSRPAQAVDTSNNSRRVDSDSGGAAGTSLAGVGAVSAIGNHACESPFQFQFTGTDLEPTTSRRSRISRLSRTPSFRAVRSLGFLRSLGNVSLPPGGEAARCTNNSPPPFDHSDPVNHIHPLTPGNAPSVPLKKQCFRIGTWNSRGKTGPSNLSEIATTKLIMRLEKVDVLVLTETHSNADSPPSVRGLNVLSHTGVNANRAGVAICALDNGRWSCLSSTILVPGHAILSVLYNSVSTESFSMLGVYGDISSYAACTMFYENLYTKLCDHIISADSDRSSLWRGCIAAGDWNFVEHASDHFPYKVPSADIT